MSEHWLTKVLKELKKEGNNGKEFEERIKLIFEKQDFRSCSFDKRKSHVFIGNIFKPSNGKKIEEIIKDVKKQVLDKDNIELIKSPFNTNIYIYIYINLLDHKTFQTF